MRHLVLTFVKQYTDYCIKNDAVYQVNTWVQNMPCVAKKVHHFVFAMTLSNLAQF